MIARLKQSEALKHVPVIVISGMVDPSVIERTRSSGAADYIAKPSNLEGWFQLGERLKQAVETYRLQKRQHHAASKASDKSIRPS